MTMRHHTTGQTDMVQAAVAAVLAASDSARKLQYNGMATELEDLAVVLGSVPAADGHRIAHALLSTAAHD
jgi:hypothetical protein